ncbi:MAG: helix-turn-helix domain-containing protein [Patescibacteria group bacterium]
MPRKDDMLYSAGKIAKFFGVAKKTAWHWCTAGKLPAFKIGKEWKVRVSDLQKMIDRKVHARDSDDSPRLF